MKTLLLVLLLASPIASHAQNSSGNGGSYVNTFKFLRDSLVKWVDSNSDADLSTKLMLGHLSAESFRMKFKMAVASVGNNIDIRPGKVYIGPQKDIPRPCGNFDQSRIECSEEDWKSAMSLKFWDYLYSIVFHEYLGIAGLEENEGSKNSTFPYSSNILKYTLELEQIRNVMVKNQKDTDICKGWLFVDFSTDGNEAKVIHAMLVNHGFSVTPDINLATHFVKFSYGAASSHGAGENWEPGWGEASISISDMGNHVVYTVKGSSNKNSGHAASNAAHNKLNKNLIYCH